MLNPYIHKYLSFFLRRITTDKYEELRAKWSKQKKKHEDRLERISQADEEYYITSAMLLELASRSYKLFMGSGPEQKRQLITLTLQNLTIKDGKLQYDWIKPFDSIFNSAKSHEWGALRDLFINLEINFNININNLDNLLKNWQI